MAYTTYGPIRGQCGHLHRTIEAAEACAERDGRGCARQIRGYSDRRVYWVGPDQVLYHLTEDGKGDARRPVQWPAAGAGARVRFSTRRPAGAL
jgi:hypothetical protein